MPHSIHQPANRKPLWPVSLNTSHWAGQPNLCFLFNEGGGNAHDLSGHRITGTLSSVADCKYSGRGLTLTNSAGCSVNCGSPTNLTNMAKWTVVARITQTGTSPGVGYFISKSSGWNLGIDGFFGSTFKLFAFDGTNQVRGNTTISNGTPYHVAAVYNGSTLAWYLNGVSDNTPASFAPTSDTGHNLLLGNRADVNNSNTQFSGFYEYLYVYPQAFTAGQVRSLYERPFQFVAAPPPKRFVGIQPPTTYNETSTGGVVIRGSATNTVIANPASSGGLVIGGAASGLGNVYDETMSGGLVISGSASPTLGNTPASSGGLVLGGTLTVTTVEYAGDGCFCPVNIYNEVSTGGLVLGGKPTWSSPTEPTSGGLVLSGGATVSVPTQVWDSYVTVYHLKEAPSLAIGNYTDSSGRHLDGTGGDGLSLNTVPTWQAGVFYKSAGFDGGRYINLPSDNLKTDSPLTVSFWAKVTARFLSHAFYMRGLTNTEAGEGWQLQIGHNLAFQPFVTVQAINGTAWTTYKLTSSTALTPGCWYHLAATWQPGVGLGLYINGAASGSLSVPATKLVPSTAGEAIGKSDKVYSYAQANLQEVRCSPTIKSADWLLAEFNNVCDGTFYTVSQEFQPVTG